MHRVRGARLGLVIACLLLPGHGQAETFTLLQSGYWKAFGGTADNGQPLCGVISHGAEGRTFAMKWFRGDGYLVVQIFKRTWSVPKGVDVAIMVQFDNQTPWTAHATGWGGSGIEFRITRRQVDRFIAEFRYAGSMRLWFPNGNEAPWTGNMTGSNGAVSAMVACMDRLDAGDRGPTQPYGSAPSQPFAPQPRAPAPAPPSQPYQGAGLPEART